MTINNSRCGVPRPHCIFIARDHYGHAVSIALLELMNGITRTPFGPVFAMEKGDSVPIAGGGPPILSE